MSFPSYRMRPTGATTTAVPTQNASRSLPEAECLRMVDMVSGEVEWVWKCRVGLLFEGDLRRGEEALDWTSSRTD